MVRETKRQFRFSVNHVAHYATRHVLHCIPIYCMYRASNLFHLLRLSRLDQATNSRSTSMAGIVRTGPGINSGTRMHSR